jgi:hypothetical protein
MVVLELMVLLGFSPGLGLFEGEGGTVDSGPTSTWVDWWVTIEYPVPAQPDQHPAGLIPQGLQESMIAIAAVRGDDVKVESTAGWPPPLAKLLDLGYPHRKGIAGTGDSLQVHRQGPTAASLGDPSQFRVGIADHGGITAAAWAGAMDVLTVGQGGRTGSRPARGVQGEDLYPLGGDLATQELPEPFRILAASFHGGVSAGPLASENRAEAQFGERAYGWGKQQGVQEFKLGVPPFGETLLVERLPELDEFVKLLVGRTWLLHTIMVLPSGGSRKP